MYFLWDTTSGDDMQHRLRDLREDADLNQTRWRTIWACPRRVIPNTRPGENDIPTQVLIKLARFYGTSVDYILGLSDIRTPYPR